MSTAVERARAWRITEIDRAVMYAATQLNLSQDVADLLPVKVVAELWREKLRLADVQHFVDDKAARLKGEL